MSKTIVPALELGKSLQLNYDVTVQEFIRRLFLVKDSSFSAATFKKKIVGQRTFFGLREVENAVFVLKWLRSRLGVRLWETERF